MAAFDPLLPLAECLFSTHYGHWPIVQGLTLAGGDLSSEGSLELLQFLRRNV
jgi:hypothetical protein